MTVCSMRSYDEEVYFASHMSERSEPLPAHGSQHAPILLVQFTVDGATSAYFIVHTTFEIQPPEVCLVVQVE